MADNLPQGWGPDEVSRLGVGGMLAVAVWSFLRGWVIPRFLYDAEKARADYWQAKAVELLGQASAVQQTAREANTAAERVTKDVLAALQQQAQRGGGAPPTG